MITGNLFFDLLEMCFGCIAGCIELSDSNHTSPPTPRIAWRDRTKLGKAMRIVGWSSLAAFATGIVLFGLAIGSVTGLGSTSTALGVAAVFAILASMVGLVALLGLTIANRIVNGSNKVSSSLSQTSQSSSNWIVRRDTILEKVKQGLIEQIPINRRGKEFDANKNNILVLLQYLFHVENGRYAAVKGIDDRAVYALKKEDVEKQIMAEYIDKTPRERNHQRHTRILNNYENFSPETKTILKIIDSREISNLLEREFDKNKMEIEKIQKEQKKHPRQR